MLWRRGADCRELCGARVWSRELAFVEPFALGLVHRALSYPGSNDHNPRSVDREAGAALKPYAMTHADNLRRRAELARRAASLPTEGSGKTNRILLTLAERLERRAASDEEVVAIERAATDKAFPARKRERSNRHKAERRLVLP